jgi:hypothetical protein
MLQAIAETATETGQRAISKDLSSGQLSPDSGGNREVIDCVGAGSRRGSKRKQRNTKHRERNDAKPFPANV